MCLDGAVGAGAELLAAMPTADLCAYYVWVPMLPSDDRNAALAAAHRFSAACAAPLRTERFNAPFDYPKPLHRPVHYPRSRHDVATPERAECPAIGTPGGVVPEQNVFVGAAARHALDHL